MTPDGSPPQERPSWFERFASAASRSAGHPIAAASAAGLIVLWAASGPIFGFSDTWQLVINTGTTVLTFLMVFLIQNTLNRDSLALHLKLDELLRATSEARDSLIGAQRLSEKAIEQLDAEEARDGTVSAHDDGGTGSSTGSPSQEEETNDG